MRHPHLFLFQCSPTILDPRFTIPNAAKVPLDKPPLIGHSLNIISNYSFLSLYQYILSILHQFLKLLSFTKPTTYTS